MVFTTIIKKDTKMTVNNIPKAIYTWPLLELKSFFWFLRDWMPIAAANMLLIISKNLSLPKNFVDFIFPLKQVLASVLFLRLIYLSLKKYFLLGHLIFFL